VLEDNRVSRFDDERKRSAELETPNNDLTFAFKLLDVAQWLGLFGDLERLFKPE